MGHCSNVVVLASRSRPFWSLYDHFYLELEDGAEMLLMCTSFDGLTGLKLLDDLQVDIIFPITC